MQALAQEQIDTMLAKTPEWTQVGDTISRTYQFTDFVEAMAFVNAVADHAEAVQHHPDVLIRWNKVTLTLSTHDAGGITNKDFEFATKADAMSLA